MHVIDRKCEVHTRPCAALELQDITYTFGVSYTVVDDNHGMRGYGVIIDALATTAYTRHSILASISTPGLFILGNYYIAKTTAHI